MRNVLSKNNILNLLVRRLNLKSSRDKLIFRFNYNKISTNKKKSREKTNIERKVLEILI